jgi:hypothetical protein
MPKHKCAKTKQGDARLKSRTGQTSQEVRTALARYVKDVIRDAR